MNLAGFPRIPEKNRQIELLKREDWTSTRVHAAGICNGNLGGLALNTKTDSKNEKLIWTTPVLKVVSITAAQGANPGPLCDKHGSLSSGSGSC